jgi:hypothetical protein
MASDVKSGQISITSPVHGSQASKSVVSQQPSGKALPPGGKLGGSTAASSAAQPKHAVQVPANPVPPVRTTDPQTLVTALNNFLNTSGRPDEFRIAPGSGNKLIQQVNPSTGEVVGVFPVDEFPALARGIGATGLLVNSLA